MADEDPLDASLRDFEHHPNSPTLLRRPHPHPPSDAATTDPDSEMETASHHHHQLHQHHLDEDQDQDSEIASGGGYSPPAWRRLGNGDRSSGFWRAPREHAVMAGMPLHQQSPFAILQDPMLMARMGSVAGGGYSRGASPETGISEQDEIILEQAMRTRLPMGSQSPRRGRSASPMRDEDPTLRLPQEPSNEPPSDNYFRFAVRAEVQQRTAPIESLLHTLRTKYQTLTSTYTSLLTILLAITTLKALLRPASPLPAGDLVKVAGVARSFEPLIYYSEHAVAQVHDLQATSVAVWDLAESVRSSDMEGGAGIVRDLDELSETMKTLAVEMTKFFARVDGDIDGILNVMDWAKMHLNRLSSSPPPSTLSSLYDNLHTALLTTPLLQSPTTGAPTSLGHFTTFILGPSNPQREQRLIQLLFTEFLTILEDSISAELQHSLTLFALFEAVDFHFLNLARAVVRESSAQEELHADLLSGLWSRILGPHASSLRKFEQNRALLRNVREKTVRNKGVLVEHNGKLLTLKASLESLRSKLVSPLVRGANATTLSLEDQIKGLSDVSEYLTEVRRKQKGKVMETLFASVPGKKYMIDQDQGVMGQMN